MEIPPPVKRHLGLDRERSWIITTEINRFNWAGPDIRLVSAEDGPFYGAIPAKLYEEMRQSILTHSPRVTKRTE